MNRAGATVQQKSHLPPSMTTRVQFPEPTEAKDRTESQEARCALRMYNTGDKLFPKQLQSIQYKRYKKSLEGCIKQSQEGE